MIYNRAKYSLLQEKANASLTVKCTLMKHIWMLSRNEYQLSSAFWMLLLLSHVPFQGIQNYCVPTNTVPIFTLNWKWASNALETQLLAKVEITSKWSSLLNTGQEAFFPHKLPAFHAVTRRCTASHTFSKANGGCAEPGCPDTAFYCPWTWHLPSPQHLHQLSVGMASPATKTQPLLGWPRPPCETGCRMT